MSRKQHTPNDERSIVKNPNNPAYHADLANRAAQAERAAARRDEIEPTPVPGRARTSKA